MAPSFSRIKMPPSISGAAKRVYFSIVYLTRRISVLCNRHFSCDLLKLWIDFIASFLFLIVKRLAANHR